MNASTVVDTFATIIDGLSVARHFGVRKRTGQHQFWLVQFGIAKLAVAGIGTGMGSTLGSRHDGTLVVSTASKVGTGTGRGTSGELA